MYSRAEATVVLSSDDEGSNNGAVADVVLDDVATSSVRRVQLRRRKDLSS